MKLFGMEVKVIEGYPDDQIGFEHAPTEDHPKGRTDRFKLTDDGPVKMGELHLVPAESRS